MSELRSRRHLPPDEVHITVCIPVYNDWASVSRLVEHIDRIGPRLGRPITVLLVDDGSDEAPPEGLVGEVSCLSKVAILQLRRNLGHQRAIALGLAYIHAELPLCDVVVMDADGEDSPEDLPLLMAVVRENQSTTIVFASRRKRSEGPVFRLGYLAYRGLHHLLIGRPLRIGNFSVIPAPLLARVVGVSELWNHYAAGITRSRLPMTSTPLDRFPRLMGRSRMNFVSLVVHGMSAIAVHGDVVGVRVLGVLFGCSLITLLTLIAVVGVRTTTNWAIPGWATTAFGVSLVTLLNLSTLAMMFVMFILQTRSMAGFLPVRDWEPYVLRSYIIHQR